MTIKPDNPLTALNDEEVRILPPEYTLKKIIGEDVDVQQVLGPESIEKAQQVILEHTNSFLEWVMADLATLEESYQQASADLTTCEPGIRKLARTAFVIKSQAGTFGFELATRIAKSLDDFCQQHLKPDEAHMTVIRKHIDALALIFHQNITGDGAAIGKELMENLSKLVEKYK